MPVIMAYALVLVIWSTTPLAVKLSNDSFVPVASVSLRFALALVIVLPMYWLLKRRPLLSKKFTPLYLVSALGIFPNMPLVYLAVEYIPSGLVSVLFGLAPFATAIWALPLLGERLLNREKILALSVSCIGLLLIFYQQLKMGDGAYIGLLLMLLSCVIFSLGNVLVRREVERLRRCGEQVDTLQQVAGSILFALPGLLLTWFLIDGFQLPSLTDVSVTSMAAIGYLSVLATIVGFVAYFHVLNTMSMAAVSLLPLLTPALAVMLGVLVAGERMTPLALAGCIVVLAGLGWYQGLPRKLMKSFSKVYRNVYRKR